MIELKQVSKRFGPQTALEEINLSADPGEILCLLGPNGSGKTTLLKVIAGLVSPDEGWVAVKGLDPQREAQEAKGYIGLSLGEERGFYGRLTGLQNLSFFGTLHGITGRAFRERIRELTEWLDLKEALMIPFRNLSSGHRQRLSLARALLHNPTILLLDEPTKNLDPNAQMEFQHFVLGKLVKVHQKTILWATHQLAEAEAVSGRLIFLKEGRILTDSTLRQIKKSGLSLREVYTQCFGSTGPS